MSKIKKQQIKMWQNIVPDLRKSIDQLIKQHREKPIRTYPPDDFEFKVNSIRSVIQSGEIFDEEDYLDVFSFLIEQRANISLLELGDQMERNFGKSNQFWTGKIQHWANLFALSSNSTVWNVTDFMRNYVNYATSPIERHNTYQWRLKAQSYLSNIEFLIRKISSPKISESTPFAIDDVYMKYYKAKVIYTTFLSSQNEMGYHETQDSDELSITNKGKRKAEMKLFNFGVGNRKVEYVYEDFGQRNPKKSVNTLEKYFFKKPNQTNEQVEVLNDEEHKIVKQKELVNVLRNVANNHEQHDIKNLRKALIYQQKKQRQQRLMREDQDRNEDMMRTTKRMNMTCRMMDSKSERQLQPLPKFTVRQREFLESVELKEYPISHFTSIFDPRDYFQHVGYRIAQRSIDIANPFILYPWVNYWINDEQEYDDLVAVDLEDEDAINTDNDQNTDQQDTDVEDQDDQIGNDESFIDNRKVIVGGYIDGNTLTAEDLIEFKNQIHQGDQKWVANFKNQKPFDQNHTNINKSSDTDSQESSYINLGLQVIPVYGGQLPYPLEGSENFRTKRRNPNTKTKSDSINNLQLNHYKMEEIMQNLQEDNCTSNCRQSNSRMLRQNLIESIKEVKLQNQEDVQGVETTFEQKVDEKAEENENSNLNQLQVQVSVRMEIEIETENNGEQEKNRPRIEEKDVQI